ncbi:aldo/keto reductase [Allosediminivita pacifica]|uniref:Aryl-alcohol dehydrogenase-like predicted oxidoreductase n=1 Tax=Allosediminivita pacifica TaxID=1267769 RepID=A0A2T6AX92_9RHOB|nr:aldo/keto reductase [Allosediminivita pacifica]PTX48435.1 aryl-alcohol dehydrogenase-like predicted oxidoreductase [Allosediminivita pacifica]GGB10515.1 NADP-dependent oxidoreductase [Allosediminivita pacifica]
MQMRKLGWTDLQVSELCLGTMTYGNQTPPEDAYAQIEMAQAAGINFMDAAEMYPVNPVRKETIGLTEQILGDWFEKSGKRNDWILATKQAGVGSLWREGTAISSETIPQAIEGSLKRLKTDVIDLYQFHWPNRGSYHFRQNWRYDPAGQDKAANLQHMQDALGALQREVERGTIRYFGLSNDTAWGTAQWARMAEETGGPRVVSVQNEYSLMYRLADTDLAEALINEQVGLLPFSPLACGLLTGKYQGGALPEGSRMAINGDLGGRKYPRAFEAVDAYLKVAEDFGLDPVHMALAWSARRSFVSSSIFGATTVAQLERSLGAADVTLSEELLEKLDEVHRAHPLPY